MWQASWSTLLQLFVVEVWYCLYETIKIVFNLTTTLLYTDSRMLVEATCNKSDNILTTGDKNLVQTHRNNKREHARTAKTFLTIFWYRLSCGSSFLLLAQLYLHLNIKLVKSKCMHHKWATHQSWNYMMLKNIVLLKYLRNYFGTMITISFNEYRLYLNKTMPEWIQSDPLHTSPRVNIISYIVRLDVFLVHYKPCLQAIDMSAML